MLRDREQHRPALQVVREFDLFSEFPRAAEDAREASVRRLCTKGVYHVAFEVAAGAESDEERLRLCELAVSLAVAGGQTVLAAELGASLGLPPGLVDDAQQLQEQQRQPQLLGQQQLLGQGQGIASSSPAPGVLEPTLRLPASVSNTFVDTLEGLAEAVEEIKMAGVVGIDAEWRPQIYRGLNDATVSPQTGLKQSRVSLLQLATPDRVFLLDLPQLLPPANKRPSDEIDALFAGVFGNPGVLKLGFGLRHDLNCVRSSYPLVPAFSRHQNLLDLQHVWKHASVSAPAVAAGLLEACSPSMFAPQGPGGAEASAAAAAAAAAAAPEAGRGGWASLSEQFSMAKKAQVPQLLLKKGTGKGQHVSLSHLCRVSLGVGLNKGCQLSDWERRPLSVSQMEYAALDAYCLLQVYSRLATAIEFATWDETFRKKQLTDQDAARRLVSTNLSRAMERSDLASKGIVGRAFEISPAANALALRGVKDLVYSYDGRPQGKSGGASGVKASRKGKGQPGGGRYGHGGGGGGGGRLDGVEDFSWAAKPHTRGGRGKGRSGGRRAPPSSLYSPGPVSLTLVSPGPAPGLLLRTAVPSLRRGQVRLGLAAAGRPARASSVRPGFPLPASAMRIALA